jgi:hypothetical protein
MNQTTPLTQNDCPAVIQHLQNGQSPQDHVRKPATEQLKMLEQRPGFTSLLLYLSQPSPQLQPSINQFAAIQLKNVIDRHWRRGQISEDERQSIKQNVLQRLAETNPRVAEQLLVVIAKIARNDAPHNWPSLFDTLRTQLTEPHAPFVLRTMNKVIKTLTTKRKASDRRVFHDLTQEMLPFFVNHWFQRQTELFQLLNQAGYSTGGNEGNGGGTTGGGAALAATLQSKSTACMYALKTVCRMISYGTPSLDTNSIVASFFQHVLAVVQSTLATVLNMSVKESQRRVAHQIPLYDLDGEDDSFKYSVEGRLRQMVEVSLRTVNRVRSNQPTAFTPYLQTFLNVTYSIVVDYYDRVQQYQELARRYTMPTLLACQFLSKCLTERDYEDPKSAGGTMVNQFLMGKSGGNGGGGGHPNNGSGSSGPSADTSSTTAPRVNVLFKIVVTTFLTLTAPDLMRWESDPEEYVLAQESVSMNSSLRATGQDLFLAMLEYDDHVMPQIFVTILNERETYFDQRANPSSNATPQGKRLCCLFVLGQCGVARTIDGTCWPSCWSSCWPSC